MSGVVGIVAQLWSDPDLAVDDFDLIDLNRRAAPVAPTGLQVESISMVGADDLPIDNGGPLHGLILMRTDLVDGADLAVLSAHQNAAAGDLDFAGHEFGNLLGRADPFEIVVEMLRCLHKNSLCVRDERQ